MIEAGAVKADGVTVLKANRCFADSATIILEGPKSRFVSRGGEKLAYALEQFQLPVDGKFCIDIGISTGGFTDCLLQAGAKKVTGIDVGHGQLHDRLVDHSRLELRENINARHLSPGDFSGLFDFAVIDVSFISLTHILPILPALVNQQADVVCLIKPQFEVGRAKLNKHGVCTDENAREHARLRVHSCAAVSGFTAISTISSPITGGCGNIEFLTHFKLI